MANEISIPTGTAENDLIAFWAVRGNVIQSYANLEQSLCLLFVHLTGMPIDVAAIIFFKIVNAGTLFGILEKLLRKKHGATYSLFWSSFLKKLRSEISDVRNQIVHWNAVRVNYSMT